MEIGSEFWLEEYKKLNNNYVQKQNEILLMSGRTAIDFAIEILQKKIEKVYMPSYCCDSMLVPFLDKKIEIEFYDVIFENGRIMYNIDLNKECDLFFGMNYFGFSSCNMDNYIDYFHNRGITIIEDGTHSFLSERKYNKKSDIVIASLRKWFPIISGSVLIVNNQNLIDKMKENGKALVENLEYTKIKEEAMYEKEKYIHKKEQIEKNVFLDKFKNANEILKQHYKNYKIDEKSKEILENLDIDDIKAIRRKNAKIIYDFLKKQKEYKYLSEIDYEKDCPLFIPIFMDEEKRSKLRSNLIQNNIYLPIHWPIPKEIQKAEQTKIYKMELSLICDQRYLEKDIEHYLKLL